MTSCVIDNKPIKDCHCIHLTYNLHYLHAVHASISLSLSLNWKKYRMGLRCDTWRDLFKGTSGFSDFVALNALQK